MHEIIITKNLVHKNQKNSKESTKTVYKSMHEIDTEMFLKKKKTEKGYRENPKNLILIDNVDIDKTLISNNVSFGKKSCKYFIEYKDN